ncbi:hypothetical protein MMG85_12150 [Pseudoxanthomonas sp. LH2527]|uniref:hypothetical protein n=1 Tax=Pseudoxanthomonas sp. LH2527 TaxID=2923249 RepID=UPI001F14612B|nr:hypothetical protein [Pseudoxanthomonas sp. LH2527]MCH6484307.1 hypothetical protein [Pseudoxanthomonas sp. LH2527]
MTLTLRERIRANLLLMLRHWTGLIGTLVFAAMGITVIGLYFQSEEPLRPTTILVSLFAFGFTPIMATLSALAVHYNRRSREPYTYTFNAEGIHVEGVTYAYTHRWAAIFRVKTLGGFLMFFFSPGAAHCLPLKRLDPTTASALIRMAREHGVAVDPANTVIPRSPNRNTSDT